MPDFAITDTHVHLWDPRRLDYPWLRNNAALGRPHLLQDFEEATAEVEVGTIVFVECDVNPAQGLDEARWIASLAEADARIQGIVAFAPLEQGEAVRPYLEQLVQVPGVKGVRRLLQGEDVDFCLAREFIQGVQMLAEFGLSFDICIRHAQMASALEMVRQCPEVAFMLDHIGKPDIRNRRFEPWKTELRELASFVNVSCKVSGLATEADHTNWTREDLKPYVEHVLDCFGWDRVAYGGDWPVATLATPYPRWVEALEWAVEGCSDEQRRALFHTNAVRFYRLSG